MPGIRDDIIIKGAQLAGTCDPTGGMLGAANALAKEIQALGLLGEAKLIDQRLHAAYKIFRDALQDAIDDMQELIDKHVIP